MITIGDVVFNEHVGLGKVLGIEKNLVDVDFILFGISRVELNSLTRIKPTPGLRNLVTEAVKHAIEAQKLTGVIP